ncbi:hypothetical protein PUV54_03235 [Hyphococcus flavus]|uniref:Uncharacterized protein n=1 Tax=Hyphococcus flavus TaxID=1866326 RepID=A0AAE9ZKB8_9PROT|nr:hypothetical protein [Hyphococcus flavus]WDI32205.1 hypothetical protein PUV54_03235 [Hyphococcus flavus]
MTANSKAIVKDAVFYGASSNCRRAPLGEYTVNKRCDCVLLCSCNGGKAFSLSLDSFLQHLTEGRIALVG